jgi:plastocyanin
VSKALAALLASALAATLALAPVPGPLVDDAGAAADCTWQRHSKRIVKHVKRRGRAHRLVQRRHWWTCDRGAVAQPAAIPSSLPASPVPMPPADPEPPALGYLGVKAEEYSYTLSRPGVAAGEVIVELNNQGEDPHNLNLQRAGDGGPPLEVDEAGSLEHRTGRFTLAAGTYRLWCSLPEHDELGMHANLVVAAG